MNDHALGVTCCRILSRAISRALFARAWLLLILLAAAGSSWAAAPAPIAMPLISRNVPAFSSSGPGTIYSGPAVANDANYQSLWFSEPTPVWLAYDLSSVPVNQRHQILVAWYAGRSLGYINTTPSEFIQIPIDYTIETNAAAGGTNTAPTTGWQTAVTVTGNNRGCRQHLIDIAGANWVRLSATASSNPAGIAIDLDIHSAPAGASDCWLFMGDSITGFVAYLFSDLPGRVNALASDRWPVIVAGGIGGSNEYSANDVIDESLALFPGRFVTLNYGTNGGGAGFTAAMEILIQKVIAAGKTPVIPHMPWSDIPDQLAKAPLVNAQIDALYLKYPEILRGPDLYAAFLNRTDLIPSGDVHPNGAGNDEMRRQWALAMTAASSSAIVPPGDLIVTFMITDDVPESSSLPMISTFLANPISIVAGSSATLTWNATGATSFSISPGVGTVSGSSVSVSPSATTTYTLTATNAAGSVEKSATVTVSPAPITSPVITSFTASPSAIIVGANATLNWSVSNATSLSINPDVGAVTGTSTTVSPTATTTYTLIATNGTTSVMQSTTVNVTPVAAIAPVINSFTIDSTSLADTGMCTLIWDVTGTANLSVSPSVGTVSGNGISVSPLASTTYTLTATNSAGTVSATANVALSTPVLTLEKAPVVKIRRDDHVATVEMDFDPSVGWGSQLWSVGTDGRDGCGYRVQWWPEDASTALILSTDGCSTAPGSTASGSPVVITAAARQLVTPNRAVQIQPIANNLSYRVRVERLNGLGQVCSAPTEVTFNGGDPARVASLRSSLTFFDDFNLVMGAPDERKWNNAAGPQTDPRLNLFFINDQLHVHTLNGTRNDGAGDRSQVAQRPRKPIAIETGVRRRIVFDMDGIFSPRSVWYLDLNPVKTDLTGHMSFFDMDGDKGLPADVLRLRANGDGISVNLIDSTGASLKIAEANLADFGRRMGPNVRRAFDVRVGTDGIQIFVDGTSVLNASFPAGAFKPGTYDLLWSTIGYNTSKDNNPFFLSHWDNFGFDGPDLEPRAVHNYVTRIAGSDMQKAEGNQHPTFTVKVPDDIRPTAPGATSEVWLVFGYLKNDYSSFYLKPGDYFLFNGRSIPLPAAGNNTSPLDPTAVDYAGSYISNRVKIGEVAQGGTSPLKVGDNTIQFFAANTGIMNLHLEVICPENAKPPYTSPCDIHPVPMHADLPKLGPPARFIFIDGKELSEDENGDMHGPTIAGKTNLEVLVGNGNWANWAPQWLNFPATSQEIWSTGGTAGIKSVELFLRRKGTGSGRGDRIAVLTTSRDAPAPQVRYVFDFDTRRYPNGEYEIFVEATTLTGVKSHPEYSYGAFRWDASEWSGAYEPVAITIAN